MERRGFGKPLAGRAGARTDAGVLLRRPVLLHAPELPGGLWGRRGGVRRLALLVGRPAFLHRAHPSGKISAIHFALLAALAVPLLCLSFHPVEEIDSINYLHYLIEWMGNRATPYTFATNYVAFWELSFPPGRSRAWTGSSPCADGRIIVAGKDGIKILGTF